MAKVRLELEGKDKGAAIAVKGVTSAMVNARVAFTALSAGFKKLISIGKDAIALFGEQERVEAQLEQVIISTGQAAGVTAEEMKDLASSLQEVTKFGDEATIGGLNMLLTFTKIGKDVIPAATETMLNMSEAMGTDLKGQAIQLGKALNDPIAGISALADVGVSLSEDQKSLIQSFVDVGDIAGAQMVILGELETQFGGAARAARKTFGGSLQALKNIQDDNLEAFGRIISVVGKDYVDAMTAGANALNDFLSNAELIGNIAGTFEVLKEILTDLAQNALKVVKEEFEEVQGSIEKLLPVTEDTFDVFDILAGVVQVLSLGLTIAIKITGGMIREFVDLARVVKSAVKVMSLFNQSLTNPKKWKETSEAIGQLKDAFVDLAVNAMENSADLISTVVEGFSDMPKQIEQSTIKYRDTFLTKQKEIKDGLEKSNDEMVQDNKETGKEMVGDLKTLGEETKSAWQIIAEQAHIDWVANNPFKGLLHETSETFKALDVPAKFEAITGQISQWGGEAISLAKEITSTIQNVISEQNATNLAEQQQWMEDSLTNVDDWMAAELERQGIRAENSAVNRQQELDDANMALNDARTEKEQADAHELIGEKKKKLDEQKILDSAEKQKAKIRADADRKMIAEKKKQFQSDKAFSIGNIWLNAAASVMGWWAAFAGMGIPGIVLAAVMSAATLSMAGVQTGIVASQTFHGEQGGVVPSGTTTGDNNRIFANKGEALLRSDDFNALVSQARGDSPGGRSIIIENMTVMANDPESFKQQTIELARFEENR